MNTGARWQDKTDPLDRLAGEIGAGRMGESGWNVDADEIAIALRGLRRKLDLAEREGQVRWKRGGAGGVFRIESKAGGGGLVSAMSPGGLGVSFSIDGPRGDAVVIENRQTGTGGETIICDTPSGGAGRVEVLLDRSRARAYVGREEHFSCGVKWDPSPGRAADIFYHENGETLCTTRYLQGMRQSRGDVPVFEAFWPNGSRRIAEYGKERTGKHRPLIEGPAYLEFDRQGTVVFSFFALNGKMRTLHNGGGSARGGGGRPENINFDGMPANELTMAEAWAARARAMARKEGEEGSRQHPAISRPAMESGRRAAVRSVPTRLDGL